MRSIGSERWLAGAAVLLIGLALVVLVGAAGQTAQAADSSRPGTIATAVPALAATPPSWTSELPLTTTTLSLYKENACAVWGEAVGSSPTVTVTAGPVLVSYSLFSRYMQTPSYEYDYVFSQRVGAIEASLTLNGQPLSMTYRGELRIEYVPAPVSRRYSYATYGLMHVEPGSYAVAGMWRLASGETDGPRNCRLVVIP